MQMILISGLSGSGKSIALNVLEDAGYFCVDNLPATLLPRLARHLGGAGYERLAVAVDVRSGVSIAALPQQVKDLRELGIDLRFIFLDARDDTLIARFSETRRRHPLADETSTLAEALRAWIKDFVELDATAGLTLLFESFGFKHGIPLDADLVFDVRCLPNPYYDLQLRPLTGKDEPVIRFLEAQPDVLRMGEDIQRFVAAWLPCYVRDNRAYLTVAIGCTGGQHRSVYLAERLSSQFRDTVRVLVRHRSMR